MGTIKCRYRNNKKAYKKIVIKYHPDNNPSDIEAEKKFEEVGNAYAILGDPNKRKEYDLSRTKKCKGLWWISRVL